MSENLKIGIELDRSQSKADAAAFRAEQKKLAQSLLSDAEVAERAQRELIKRTNQEKIKAAADAADAAKKARAEEIAAAKAAADAEVAAAKAKAEAARDAANVAKQAARDKAQAERDAARVAAQAAKDASRDAQKASTDAARIAKANLKEKAKAEADASKATKQRLQEEEEAVNSGNDAVKNAISGIAAFGVQMLGLSSAIGVIHMVADEIDRSRVSAMNAGKEVTEYREALLELAALKGQLGGTTQTLKEDIEFRSKTLQKRADARTFQETALGVGESAIDNAFGKRNISREEFAKAMELGGSFQATEGGDAKAHAALVGLIPTLGGKGGRMTGEDVFKKESQLFSIFQPGGATFSSLASQYSKLAPLIKSGVYKDTEAAALLSAFSTTNMEGAGENVHQFTRATLGGIGRKGVARVENAEQVGKYLKEIGITDDVVKKTKASQLPFAIADAVSNDLIKQEKEANARGEEFSAKKFLGERWTNQEDADALLQYHGLRLDRSWQDSFLPLAGDDKAAGAAAKRRGEIADARRTDPAMQSRASEYAEELSKVAVGAGPEEFLTSLKRTAFARRRVRGEETHEKYEDVATSGSLNPSNLLYGNRRQNDVEAQRMLMQQALANKVPFRDLLEKNTTFANGIIPSEQEAYRGTNGLGDNFMVELGRRLNKNKVNPLGGAGDVMSAAQAQLDAAKAFERGEEGPTALHRSVPLPLVNPAALPLPPGVVPDATAPWGPVSEAGKAAAGAAAASEGPGEDPRLKAAREGAAKGDPAMIKLLAEILAELKRNRDKAAAGKVPAPLAGPPPVRGR